MQTKRGLEKPSRGVSKDNKTLDSTVVRRKTLDAQVIREVRPLLLYILFKLKKGIILVNYC